MSSDLLTSRTRFTSPWIYLAATTLLASVALTVRPATWQGSVVSHTMLELAATLLALVVGVVAMIRFSARRETLHLFVGIGFLGAALFDGQHLLLTSPWWLGSAPPAEHWNWNPSRLFLALELVFGWWACRRELQLGQAGRTPSNSVYFRLAMLTLVSFAVAVFAPLQRRYSIEGLLGRPDELLAGALFLIALLGFLRLNEQSPSVFLRWLILALAFSFVGQVFVMSRSQALFDALFMAGHWTKIACYLCILVGLLIDFYRLFTEAQRGQESLARAVDALQQEMAERERAQHEAAIAHDALKSHAAELEASRTAALNILQDLETSRRQAIRAEQATRDQAACTQAILDNASDAIITTNFEGVVESFNRAAEKIFGYPAGQVIGKNVNVLMPSPYHEEHDQYLHNYLTTGISKIIGIGREVFGLRADGTTFPMHLAISDVKLRGRRIFTGIVRDITDVRLAMQQVTAANDELARRSRQIERFNFDLSRSNEDLKQFAYVASHDLQEPLRKVTAFCQMLRDDYSDRLDENARTYIQYAVDGAMRMKTLVQDLLAYSRVETQGKPLEPTDANDACAEAIENLAVAIAEAGAEVTREPLPTINADPVQLESLFQNLIGNAIKYRGSEPPRIQIRAAESGGEWVFRIRDNGIGIDPIYHERIFVIFQRLHGREEYSGTGIGLAVCKRIVERAGGRIWVESQAGAGSEFCFAVPIPLCQSHTSQEGVPNYDRKSPQAVGATH